MLMRNENHNKSLPSSMFLNFEVGAFDSEPYFYHIIRTYKLNFISL